MAPAVGVWYGDCAPFRRMDPATQVGTAMMRPVDFLPALRAFLRPILLCGCLCVLPMAAHAAERYALVVTGASGGPEYAQRYRQWRESFTDVLRVKYGYPEDHVIVLADEDDPAVDIRKST